MIRTPKGGEAKSSHCGRHHRARLTLSMDRRAVRLELWKTGGKATTFLTEAPA